MIKTFFKKLLWFSTFLSCTILLTSCSHGPPFESVLIGNVRAKPGSHIIAVALKYHKLREPTGFINTFPNGGVYKVLDEKAMIYICDIDSLEVNRVVSMTPPKELRISWSVSILGWAGESLYFKLYGQPGTRLKDFQNRKMIIYKYDYDGSISEVPRVPDNIAFQHNSGPLPDVGVFVRVSKGHSDIDIMTERQKEYKTLFRTINALNALVSVEDVKTE